MRLPHQDSRHRLWCGLESPISAAYGHRYRRYLHDEDRLQGWGEHLFRPAETGWPEHLLYGWILHLRNLHIPYIESIDQSWAAAYMIEMTVGKKDLIQNPIFSDDTPY